MKKDIHPKNYRMVIFKDMSCEQAFLTKSAAPSKETTIGFLYKIFKGIATNAEGVQCACTTSDFLPYFNALNINEIIKGIAFIFDIIPDAKLVDNPPVYVRV